MAFDIEPFLLDGFNLGISAFTNALPGGNAGLEAGCDALELAGKMAVVIAPRLRDGKLSKEEAEAILGEFKQDVPAGTFILALSALKSTLDRVVGGSFGL